MIVTVAFIVVIQVVANLFVPTTERQTSSQQASSHNESFRKDPVPPNNSNTLHLAQ